MPITDQILDQLLADCKSPEDLMGEHGLLRQLTKKLAERALDAELEHHLGYPKNSPSGKNTGNSRNGKTAKTVRSVHGDIELDRLRAELAKLDEDEKENETKDEDNDQK